MDLSQDIKLIALDLDGTLFNSQSIISKENIKAIKAASDAGVNIVISTGRPFCGDPFEQISGSGIDYSINANGSSAYRISTGECLFEDPLDDDVVIPVIEYLLTQRVHMDAFIKGQGYSPVKCLKDAKELSMPPSLHKYIMNTRKRVDSLVDLIKTEGHVQKMTINFPKDQNGNYYCRDEVFEYLTGNPALTVVSGGYGNLEFTKAGVDKGVGLKKLSGILNIPLDQTMAIGDTENDLAIIKSAHIGVAMENATEQLKADSDYITDTNDNDGVAKAIYHFLSL